jgi:citrate lyase subunit beta / citryl-CoA lyase
MAICIPPFLIHTILISDLQLRLMIEPGRKITIVYRKSSLVNSYMLVFLGKRRDSMIRSFRRSLLYVPGDSVKMLQKAAAFPSDLLLLNLEDGVASAKKDEARGNVAHALNVIDFGAHEIVVRVNGLSTEVGLKDLAAVVPMCPDGICLPKMERAVDIQAADAAILELEIGHGLPEGGIRLHAMIESAAGLLRSSEIASASPRMASLVFGSADFISDMRCIPGEDRAELLLALQLIAASARSAGIDAVDAPCFNLKDPDLLRRESAQARRIGFDGKSALHPDQLGVINEVFDVTAEEIAWAERMIAELNHAEAKGKALTTVDGNLIDNPHRKAAERILLRKSRRS